MEGLLAKKTKGGKWKERFFKVADGKLSWFKSDNKTILSVDLVSNSDQGKSNNPPSTVRDVKFGVRKVSSHRYAFMRCALVHMLSLYFLRYLFSQVSINLFIELC